MQQGITNAPKHVLSAKRTPAVHLAVTVCFEANDVNDFSVKRPVRWLHYNWQHLVI